jgi:chromosome segregation ATPase
VPSDVYSLNAKNVDWLTARARKSARQVKDLERTQQATQQALDEARSARKEAMRLHTDSMAEAWKKEEEKKQLEEKMRLLTEKVDSLEADLDKAKSSEFREVRLLTSQRACS